MVEISVSPWPSFRFHVWVSAWPLCGWPPILAEVSQPEPHTFDVGLSRPRRIRGEPRDLFARETATMHHRAEAPRRQRRKIRTTSAQIRSLNHIENIRTVSPTDTLENRCTPGRCPIHPQCANLCIVGRDSERLPSCSVSVSLRITARGVRKQTLQFPEVHFANRQPRRAPPRSPNGTSLL